MATKHAYLNLSASCIMWLKSMYKPLRLARVLSSMLLHAM